MKHEEIMARSEPEWRTYVANALREGAEHRREQDAAIAKNTLITEKISADTSLLVDMMTTARVGGNIIRWLGWAALTVGGIATAYHLKWPWVS